tara:strand:+ start:2663 stop:3499 length:837 start_codon:yes stop_codon:yes gene_type:complete
MATKKQERKIPNSVAMAELVRERQDMLSKHIPPNEIERFMDNVLSSINKIERLSECSPASFYKAAHQCALLNLQPGHFGHVYLVPFKKQVTIMVGYKGLIELAMRHPDVTRIKADIIYKGDHFSEDIADMRIEHSRSLEGDRSDDAIVGAYCRIWLKGFPEPTSLVLNRSQIDGYRKLSKASGGNFWTRHFGAMARKTVIRALLNGGEIPMSTQLRDAIDAELEAEKQNEILSVEPENRTPVVSNVRDSFKDDLPEKVEYWTVEVEDVSSEQEVPSNA